MQMINDIKDNVENKRENEHIEITLAESAIELLPLDLSSIEHMEHCILFLNNQDVDYLILDLVTFEIISIYDE